MDMEFLAIKKLMKLLPTALGKIIEPYQIKRLADADAENINVISEAIRNNPDVDILYDKNGVRLSNESNNLLERTVHRVRSRELTRQKNLECIATATYENLKNKGTVEVSKKPVDNDWFMRFMNYAQDVSNEDVQKIWAQLLAKEIIDTGYVSLKTLNTLHDLSVQEVRLFQKVSRYVIENTYIYNDENLLKGWNISFDDILALNDAGLMNPSGMLARVQKLSNNDEIIMNFGEYALIGSYNKSGTNSFHLPGYLLTKSGRELCGIVGDCMNIDDIVLLSKNVKENKKEFSVSLHRIESIDGERIKVISSDMISDV